MRGVRGVRHKGHLTPKPKHRRGLLIFSVAFSYFLFIFYLPRCTSPPNSNIYRRGRLIFSVAFSYFLFIFYLPRCTLPEFRYFCFFPGFQPFLPCFHRTTTTGYVITPLRNKWTSVSVKLNVIFLCMRGLGNNIYILIIEKTQEKNDAK